MKTTVGDISNTRQSQTADSAPCVAALPVGLLSAHVTFLSLYTQGHYVRV